MAGRMQWDFYHGLLGVYRYVSGDDKYERPFDVTGYGDEVFQWDQHRIAALLEEQYRARPEGPHCENTKIWFACNSAAGLGLHLYDRIHGRDTHRPVEGWLEYARDNYVGVGGDGRLEWITSYYDPVVNHKANGGPASGLVVAFLLLPQDRALATLIYESAANALGWNDPRGAVRASATGLILARELGDHTSEARLRAAAEREFEPRFFGAGEEKFGWWFGLNEAYPRGQNSASLMVAEVGEGDAWNRAFDAPHLDKFDAPTVAGVDFPSLGIYQAWNDAASGVLHVGTYAAAPDRRGLDTSWRVTGLPDPGQVFILCDGEPFSRFAIEGPDAIRIDGAIDLRHYQIFTGYRGSGRQPPQARRRDRPARAAAAKGQPQDATRSFSASGPACPCCPA